MMRIVRGLIGLGMAVVLATEVSAQSRARIFDVELGSHVSNLPTDQWFEPSCGTNGGPPSLRLAGFEDFARCRVETETGLREVWFIYDDEWEYIARAYRDPAEIGRYSANVFYNQPIITSLLVDEAGHIQGYRVVTDPRAPTDLRLLADELFGIFRSMFSGGSWECADLPREEREMPVDGKFLKARCVLATPDRFVRIYGSHLRKPGQDVVNIPGLVVSSIGETYFESQSRLEVFTSEAVRESPCCQAYALP